MKKSNVVIGMLFPTKSGSVAIKEINSATDITVEFIQTGFIGKGVTLSHLAKGEVKDPLSRSVCNTGFLGKVYPKGYMKNKVYKLWLNMINRAYSGRFKAYAEVEVDERWHNFSLFEKDIKKLTNYKEWLKVGGYDLDKDTLSKGALIYSPATCCFLPSNINRGLARKNEKE